MTKIVFSMAIALAAVTAPALAHNNNQPVSSPNDPCVLGSNAPAGACVGPVRVAPVIVSQGGAPTALQPQFVPAPAPQMAMPVMHSQPQYQAPSPAPQHAQVQSGCVPGYSAPTMPCSGYWVPAQAQFTAPPVHHHAPAPVAQFVPAQFVPAQVVQQAPIYQTVQNIPTSFFTGGISYGAGFGVEQSGYGGGGGFIISSGSGTRFSGVRERSPTALIPPPPRQRHNPPPAHRPPCCKH